MLVTGVECASSSRNGRDAGIECLRDSAGCGLEVNRFDLGTSGLIFCICDSKRALSSAESEGDFSFIMVNLGLFCLYYCIVLHSSSKSFYNFLSLVSLPMAYGKVFMINTSFNKAGEQLSTILDFWRYGITMAQQQGLFYGHGTDNPQDDIWWLITGTLGLPYEDSQKFLQARLTQDEKELLLQRLFARIVQHIPVAYILQQAYFCGLNFFVDERVLIPRSPIGQLIENQFAPWVNPDQVHRILDLCTGSGCIGIACCYAFPEAKVDAVDYSLAALDVAAINQQSLDVVEQLELIHSDCWDSVPDVQYDIIVSNPPYVSDDEMASLPQEYGHEPDLALRAQNHGLHIVEKILQQAYRYLAEDGILVVEVGNSQHALIEAYPSIPFTWLEFEHGGDGVFLLTKEQLGFIA